jgi:hypothetical protein
MGFYESPEEILAVTRIRRIIVTRISTGVFPGICGRTVYLHPVLSW